MSEYFEVTTDYLLTGKEEVKKGSNDNTLVSKILYLASAAFIGIGLLAVVRHFISTALVKLFRQITHIISTHHIILSKEKELDDTLKFLI